MSKKAESWLQRVEVIGVVVGLVVLLIVLAVRRFMGS
jgi:hypothetical protein